MNPTPALENDRLLAAIDQQLIEAKRTQHRRLVVISGPQSWGGNAALKWLERHSFDRTVWVGNRENAADYSSDDIPQTIVRIDNSRARSLLGTDIDCLVVDTWEGLDPNALAIVVGALVGGGLLILLTPSMDQWQNYVDPDYRRLLVHPFTLAEISGRFQRFFQGRLLDAKNLLMIEQDSPPYLLNVDETLSAVVEKTNNAIATERACITFDQERAVECIVKVAGGRGQRPLVIKSDRGRGKSSALGIASAQLLRGQASGSKLSILLTAPNLGAVKPVFLHASRLLEGSAKPRPGLLNYQSSELRFVPPDELIRHSYKADLLLVDEAAAIPASMLRLLLERYNRVVFSTTVHGYEGTGRGFDIRFRKTLDEITPRWSSLVLNQPVRWADGDPLERWVFDSLLLDARAVEDELVADVLAEHSLCYRLDRDQLLAREDLLQQIFGLLVSAHYQTTPADLRNLLDGPNIEVWVSLYRGHVVAAMLVAREGGFDRQLSRAIWRGQRRPRGHLIPQTLGAHCGLQLAPELTYLRIMRIAVHPVAQRRGLGKKLFDEIMSWARDEKVDFIGSSFAATADVMAFWRAVGCLPVRLGFSADASSGCHSALVLSSLSPIADNLLLLAEKRFKSQFHYNLPRVFQLIDTDLVIELLRAEQGFVACEDLRLDQQDWLDIEAFGDGYRQFEMCGSVLTKFVYSCFADGTIGSCLELSEQVLLIRRVLQNQAIEVVVKELGFSGKKQLLAALRSAIKTMKNTLLGQSGIPA